ncbi:uncharacterized protein [Lepeophtheirus salmonis]|uniref:uncharacterized protein n=1 Tax=Lepeophtheirus salmonis TaxID=72036 RepID=UPI001AE14B6B|nr:uncharacterized protein LOC121119387 [Lepeophtheirus salmonis]
MIFAMEDNSDESGENGGTLMSRLSGSTKLERDRALGDLKKQLDEDSFVSDFVEELHTVFKSSTFDNWEMKCGVLSATQEILKHKNHDIQSDFAELICNFCCKCLSDEEVRVRSIAGSTLGSLVGKYPQYYSKNIEAHLLHSISQDLNRSTDQNQSEQTILHDTAGWRYLETSIDCLKSIVVEMGPANFLQTQGFTSNEFVNLILLSTKHMNRFVRETSYYTIGSIVQTLTPADEAFAKALSYGMADNWSQVRMSAVVATRTFLTSRTGCVEEDYYSLLLPRLCLNRYYLAEGVRIYSQETWTMVVGQRGKQLVEKYISEIINCYNESADADNHAVREAACHCITEMVKKINPKVLEPFVPVLLNTLIKCFKDDSWPVRDTACVACGTFILKFPDNCRDSFEQCKPLFMENLKDPIISVRQGAAIALANCIKAYGKEQILLPCLLQDIKAGLMDVANQPSETIKYEGTSELSQFGVSDKKLRDNDIELHENQVMYSCGSLAPKMSRGGCSDGGRFRKPSEPWEKGDGFTHLLAEISSICPEEVASILPCVSEAARHKHYSNHFVFIESMLKRLPEIAKNLEKKLFKPLMEHFIEPIFYALDSENQLASVAAEFCINELCNFLGLNIFRGRVEQFNPSYLNTFDRIQFSSISKPIDISARNNSNITNATHLGGTPT